MSRSLEQTLLSLLPTHNTALLPEPLTLLASSLLAQSRHRASTLKAEEEVARQYACAHLACDRLKTVLDLPPIDPRPPILPRIYKRLYSHLDRILPATAVTPSSARNSPGGASVVGSAGRVRTPASKLREQLHGRGNHGQLSPLAGKSTGRKPAEKEKSLADLRGTTTTTTTPSKHNHNTTTSPTTTSQSNSPLPRWILPTLRLLLIRVGPPTIGPVVASALESIITPSSSLTKDAWVLDNLPATLGALYIYVWRGVTWPSPSHSTGGEDRWEGWREVGVRELDAAAVRGAESGWFLMEWVDGVGDLVERERERVLEGDELGSDDGEEEEGGREGGRIRRVDSMFREEYDYLSERKRKAYAAWEEGIFKRIKALEA
ncbi:origin recognition complex subunit 6-domain-containing protein [Dichotomopilus funicola]|uniref:Origin recognition complex subunit 6-domain-containing protein n=1 Tax=Dichotomopilus funicola TaxID=1934379 RepID=A0AAN6UY99_9PEZI|nr:origin recognition complex subunit 6-domain-containing protein [Dichotomopilus funicola]